MAICQTHDCIMYGNSKTHDCIMYGNMPDREKNMENDENWNKAVRCFYHPWESGHVSAKICYKVL